MQHFLQVESTGPASSGHISEILPPTQGGGCSRGRGGEGLRWGCSQGGGGGHPGACLGWRGPEAGTAPGPEGKSKQEGRGAGRPSRGLRGQRGGHQGPVGLLGTNPAAGLRGNMRVWGSQVEQQRQEHPRPRLPPRPSPAILARDTWESGGSSQTLTMGQKVLGAPGFTVLSVPRDRLASSPRAQPSL